MSKHFISYSHRDGTEQAFALHDDLLTGIPAFSAWIDQPDLRAGAAWDDGVDRAIGECETLLFVMTRDSVVSNSVCSNEVSRALRFKKPIVPLLYVAGVVPPLLLERRQYIDFTDSLDVGLAKLRKYLRRLKTPEGILDLLRDRLNDAQRDLGNASDQDRPRILAEIEQLNSDIDRQRVVIANPQKAAEETRQNIARALERERHGVEAPKDRKVMCINQAPMGAPSHFQDRHVETKLLGDFLKSDDRRIATVVGRGGTGKTAMVCRLLKGLEGGHLPDDLGPLPVDGVVYLTGNRIGPSRILADLSKLLPQADADRLRMKAQDSQLNVSDLFESLLAAFPEGRTVLFLDNFETQVDEERLCIREGPLAAALKTVLDAPEHGVKVIITTRIAPKDLALTQPGRQSTLYLDKGLDSPHAENVLRALDQDGTVGLKTAPDAILSLARERTRGFPRALEALYAILSSDRSTSLPEILDRSKAVLPESVVDVLVGEAFRRLDPLAQEILQALAVFGHPVSAGAVDYFLQPFRPVANSAPILNRLVNMQFTRKDGEHYFLHPVDREYALARVPEDEPAQPPSDAPAWTRRALLTRAASYFAQVRVPRDKCQSLSDLAAEQAEFDLRFAAGDYDSAAVVAIDIQGLLDRWGYFRLIDSLLGRLRGKVRDPFLQAYWALSYAGVRMRLGDIDSCIGLSREALAVLKDHPNPFLEAWAKEAYGSSIGELGQTEQAILTLRDSLDMAKAQENQGMALICLTALARCHVHLGDTSLALTYTSEALQTARDIKDADNEAVLLNNLANALGRLGQFQPALEKAQEGLELALRIKSRLYACCNQTNIGMLQIDTGHLPEAVESLVQAVEIADDVANRQFQDESRQPLALAYFCLGDLQKAREVAEAAVPFSGPQQNQPRSGLLAFLGIVALRQNDRTEARRQFAAALAEANEMLARNPKHFAVLEIKGLALCGLMACDGGSDLSEAAAAYRAARALTKDAGIVKRALRLFDGLRAGVPGGAIDGLRPVVEGAEQS